VSYSEEKQRYVVDVVIYDKKVMIKPENIQVFATALIAHGLEPCNADEVD